MTLPADLLLTPRRLEVLRYAANGYTNAEIAAELWLSENCIKSHMQIAYRALGARDRANAVAIAMVRGLIAPHEVKLRPPGEHRALSAAFRQSGEAHSADAPRHGPTTALRTPRTPTRPHAPSKATTTPHAGAQPANAEQDTN